MTELFVKVVNMSISASWVVLAVVVFRLLLKNAPKWLRVTLWGLVGIRLAIPFSFESTFSLIPSTETISPDIIYDPSPAVDTGIEALNNVVNPVISETLTPAQGASVNPLQIGLGVLTLIWCVGMVFLLIYTIISYWRLTKQVKTAVPMGDHIYQSEKVTSPFVLGLIRPGIYLPYGLREEDLPYVIAHEQTHIKRLDHWWKPIGFLLLTIHWFNPFIWLAYILLGRDIELACDEKVIQGLEKSQRADYSQALLSCSVSRRQIAACPIAFGEVGVKERIKSVLNYKKPGFWITAIAVIVGIVVAACFLTDPSKVDAYVEADLDHDGQKETIQMQEVLEDELYELKVVKQDGTVLWSMEAGIPHVGWNTILLYQDQGKDYLVQYQPTIYQGIANYTCRQFSLEGGQETEINTWAVDFELPVQPTDEMNAFAESINEILENSKVLLSTEQGELLIGPVEAVEASLIYPVNFYTGEIS